MPVPFGKMKGNSNERSTIKKKNLNFKKQG